MFQVCQVHVQAKYDKFGVGPCEKASGSYKTGYISDSVSILKLKLIFFHHIFQFKN